MSHPPPPPGGMQMHLSQQQQGGGVPGSQGNMMMDTCSDGGGVAGGAGGIPGGIPSGGTASDVAPATTKFKTRINAVIQGTLSAFAIMGQNAATWKPVEGKHASIFGVQDTVGMSASANDASGGCGSMMLNADLAAATNALRNVTVTRATVLQMDNNFGVPLGVTVNCLPRNEVIDTGDRYTFTTIPNTSVNTPFVIYEAGESHQQAMEWRKTFGKFTSANLATEDVLEVPNCSYVFVHENHPVVNLLRINKHIVGVDVDEQPRMDGQWLKITRNLFDSSCDTINKRILDKITNTDLNQFQIQLSRFGGVDWAHVSTADALMTFVPNPTWDQATMEASMKAHEQAFTEKPASIMIRMELEYELPR